MLNAVLVALTLEGVLPGLGRLRRPVPVVRYDRIHRARVRANLLRIARRLAHRPDAGLAVAYSDGRVVETISRSASTGACTVLFRAR